MGTDSEAGRKDEELEVRNSGKSASGREINKTERKKERGE